MNLCLVNNNNNNNNIVHWMLCGTYKLERAEKWYKHNPLAVVENENVKLLWDYTMQHNDVIEAKQISLLSHF